MHDLVHVTEYISSRFDDNIEITQLQDNDKFKLLKKNCSINSRISYKWYDAIHTDQYCI